MEENCVICGTPVEESEVVRCSICGVVMHKLCVFDEALLDADGNSLCPYDALIAALDWFDTVITTYTSVLNDEQKKDIASRLRAYIEILEGKEILG